MENLSAKGIPLLAVFFVQIRIGQIALGLDGEMQMCIPAWRVSGTFAFAKVEHYLLK